MKDGVKMKRRKYNNSIIEVDGEKFDSKREFDRWIYLNQLQEAGVIHDLQRQVPFVLIPAQFEDDIIGPRGGVKRGKCIEQKCSYIADFVYYDENGGLIVEDTKGLRTADYIIKRKLMLSEFKIRIKEV